MDDLDPYSLEKTIVLSSLNTVRVLWRSELCDPTESSSIPDRYQFDYRTVFLKIP